MSSDNQNIELLAGIERLGQRALDFIASNRTISILVFFLGFLLLQAWSGVRAQSFAAAVAAVLAGLGILVMTRSDDAGFQAAENQKRFLNSLATQLSVLSKNLDLIIEDKNNSDQETSRPNRSLTPSEYQRLLGNQHIALTKYHDAELATLMILDHSDKRTGDQSFYNRYIKLTYNLSSLLDAPGADNTVERPASIDLAKNVKKKASSLLEDLAEVGIEKLREAHVHIETTSGVLKIVSEAAKSHESGDLGDQFRGYNETLPERVKEYREIIENEGFNNDEEIRGHTLNSEVVYWGDAWREVYNQYNEDPIYGDWATVMDLLEKEENTPQLISRDFKESLPSLMRLLRYDDLGYQYDKDAYNQKEENERNRLEENRKIYEGVGRTFPDIETEMQHKIESWERQNKLHNIAHRLEWLRREKTDVEQLSENKIQKIIKDRR